MPETRLTLFNTHKRESCWKHRCLSETIAVLRHHTYEGYSLTLRVVYMKNRDKISLSSESL